MLSKIENGEMSPSLATLQALARRAQRADHGAFRLVRGAARLFLCPGRPGRDDRAARHQVGHHYELLGHSLGGEIVVEPYLITLKEDAEPYMLSSTTASSSSTCLRASGLPAREPTAIHCLPGDSLLFDSGARAWSGGADQPARTYLSIIIYPAARTDAR